MPKHKIHPAANLLPSMTAEEFADLKKSIAEFGQVDPITKHKGEVLDGRHRLRACEELGIDPSFIDDDELLETGGDAVEFVRVRATHRHLDASQKALLAAKFEAHRKQQNKGKCETFHTAGRADDNAGAPFGVSGRTVAKARRVLADGCHQLQQAVEDGRVDVTLAEKVAKQLPKQEQADVVAAAMISPDPKREIKKRIRDRAAADKEDTNGVSESMPAVTIQTAQEQESASAEFDQDAALIAVKEAMAEAIDENNDRALAVLRAAIEYVVFSYSEDDGGPLRVLRQAIGDLDVASPDGMQGSFDEDEAAYQLELFLRARIAEWPKPEWPNLAHIVERIVAEECGL